MYLRFRWSVPVGELVGEGAQGQRSAEQLQRVRRSAAGGSALNTGSTQNVDPVTLYRFRFRSSSDSAMPAWELHLQHQQRPHARGGFAPESTHEGRLRQSRISKDRRAGMTPIIWS